MKRREFLAGTGATMVGGSVMLGGCLSRSEPSSSDLAHGSVTIDDSAVEPADAFELQVRATEAFSERTPARLSATLTNTGNSERNVAGGPTLPFEPQRSVRTDGASALFLVPDDETGVAAFDRDQESIDADADLVPSEPVDGCWEATADSMAVFDIGSGATLGPGASHTREYVLLARPSNDGCLAGGSYTVSNTLRIDGDDGRVRATVVVE